MKRAVSGYALAELVPSIRPGGTLRLTVVVLEMEGMKRPLSISSADAFCGMKKTDRREPNERILVSLGLKLVILTLLCPFFKARMTGP
jgi:hypothetical protein